jgi:glycine/D-amino acid oxidase-like deaminating enzyme
VARILIVGGGCAGRRLAAQLTRDGHAVRITTRDASRRAEIEASGAECWIGTPDRLATLRGALDHVTVACWMLAGARGDAEQLRALHGSRLEFFLTQAIDTTVRGFLYDATPRAHDGRPDAVGSDALADGARRVARLTELNAIPAAVLDGPAPVEEREWQAAWQQRASEAIDALLAGRAQPIVVERG